MSGLDEFLSIRRFNVYTRAQIQELLRQMNGNKNCHGKKNITKADGSRTTIRVWWVPAFENQDVDLPIQEIEKDDIPF
jgi:hypothetical protein